MSLYSGFYNAIEGDRTYDALDMGRMFDGVISDGVFNGYGDVFAVTPNSGLTVNVGSGRAWFNHTWTYNDAAISFTLNSNSNTNPRLDTICFKIDTTDAVRANSIMVSEGNGYGGAVVPVNTLGVYYYPIAVISVAKDAATIKASDIHMVLGSGTYQGVTYTPYVQIANVNVNATLDDLKSDFDEWFKHMKDQLDTDEAAHLQNQIDTINDTDLSNIYMWMTGSSGSSVTGGNFYVKAIDIVDNLKISKGSGVSVTWDENKIPTIDNTRLNEIKQRWPEYWYPDIIMSRIPYNLRIQNATNSGAQSSACLITNIHSTGCYIRNMSTVEAKIKLTGYFIYQRYYS